MPMIISPCCTERVHYNEGKEYHSESLDKQVSSPASSPSHLSAIGAEEYLVNGAELSSRTKLGTTKCFHFSSNLYLSETHYVAQNDVSFPSLDTSSNNEDNDIPLRRVNVPIGSHRESILKHSESSNPTRINSSRRVRGLWNPSSPNQFSKLHNHMITNSIFVYLPIEDMISIQDVCQRFKYCAEDPSLWTHFDATGLLDRYHAHKIRSPEQHEPQNNKLEKKIKNYLTQYKDHIQLLKVQNIQQALTPDFAYVDIGSCLANNAKLKYLHLSSYDSLTDIHVKYMLNNMLSISTGLKRLNSKNINRKCNNIKSLGLEHCPLLTNTILSIISVSCPQIESISLRGCKNISDEGLRHLSQLIASKRICNDDRSDLNVATPFMKHSSGPLLNRIKDVPDQTNLFTSLFQPSLLSSNDTLDQPSFSTSALKELREKGKLTSFDFSDTHVTATGFLDFLRSSFAQSKNSTSRTPVPFLYNDLNSTNSVSGPSPQYCISSLKMGGSGETWSTNTLLQLDNFIVPNFLEALDISCSDLCVGSTSIDENTWIKFAQVRCSQNLKELRVGGHLELGWRGVVELIHQIPSLRIMDLEGCIGVFKTMARDENGQKHLRRALQNPSHSGGLTHLKLKSVFPSKEQCLADVKMFNKSVRLGSAIVDAICFGPSSSTLKELDFEECYFIDITMVNKIRSYCTNLRIPGSIKLKGTQCAQDQEEKGQSFET